MAYKGHAKDSYRSFINKEECQKIRAMGLCNDDCIISCPTEAISIKDGYAVVDDKCIGCGMCLLMCPQGTKVIEIKLPDLKEESEKK